MRTTTRSASAPDDKAARPPRYTLAQTAPHPISPPSVAQRNTDVRQPTPPSHSEAADKLDRDCRVEIATCSFLPQISPKIKGVLTHALKPRCCAGTNSGIALAQTNSQAEKARGYDNQRLGNLPFGEDREGSCRDR